MIFNNRQDTWTGKLLAIDASSSCTGWAVLDLKYNNFVDYGLFKYHRDELYHNFMRDIQSVILQHEVTHILLEDCFLGPNAVTFKCLSGLQGVVFAIAGNAGITVETYTASEWRKIVGIKANVKLNYKSRVDCKNASLELAKMVTGTV